MSERTLIQLSAWSIGDQDCVATWKLTGLHKDPSISGFYLYDLAYGWLRRLEYLRPATVRGCEEGRFCSPFFAGTTNLIGLYSHTIEMYPRLRISKSWRGVPDNIKDWLIDGWKHRLNALILDARIDESKAYARRSSEHVRRWKMGRVPDPAFPRLSHMPGI